MPHRLFAALPAFAFLIAPASAQTASEAKPPEKPQKLCRKVVPTGTMLGRSICLTAQEWTELDARNADSVAAGRNRTTTARERIRD